MQTYPWQPSAPLANLKLRSQCMQKIRAFFQSRGYLEVETPIMGQFGVTDRYLDNVKAFFRGKPYCLQTSPEYHMKRLLAAGSGPIFQLSRVFRDDELGRWHNPEFTLLEWYQPLVNHEVLIAEVDDLLQQLLQTGPLLKKTYQQAFRDSCDLDPFTATLADFQEVLKRYDLEKVLPVDEEDRDQYLFLLMSHVVEPSLAQEPSPIVIYNFPPSQAALAQIKEGVAERFEIYYQGVELANGFHELTDSELQRSRFMQDLSLRRQQGLEEPAIDVYLLAALEAGLPPCSGVALGVDRLLALVLKQKGIAETLAFAFDRA